jgi:hypothetical protein
MGQYWKVVNLDKREYVMPHRLGSGLKLWEQLANSPGTGEALIVLCAAMPEARGGGDFDLDANWHGPERTGGDEGPIIAKYQEIAHRTIGRWAGDRIALVGDYAEDTDLAPEHEASTIYGRCEKGGEYTDVSDDVAAVIEHELNGKYTGTGWRDWTGKA